MEEITLKKFISLVSSYGSAVHFEFCSDAAEWESNFFLYADRGCAISVIEYDYNGQHNIRIAIHQTSPDSDVFSVTEDWMNQRSEFEKIYENPSTSIFVFVVTNGEIPEKWDRYMVYKNFSRQGKAYPADERVRLLTANDIGDVKALCEPSIQDDTAFGKRLARSFHEGFEHYIVRQDVHAYGIYENGELCGIAICDYSLTLGILNLGNIFISKQHRNRGLGKALVRNALSEYPDVKWAYQSDKNNDASIALAESLGFTLEGASLYVN